MVRLIEVRNLLKHSTYYSFNSSMVRLIVITKVARCQNFIRFQFQYGAIDRFILSTNICRCSSFNSSMVRLIAFSGVLSMSCFSCFNSSMVRLIEIYGKGIVVRHLKFQFQYGAIDSFFSNRPTRHEQGFNSSMVRLIVYLCQHAKSICEFQFQYGAIDRAVHGINARTCVHVSIPVWCDW